MKRLLIWVVLLSFALAGKGQSRIIGTAKGKVVDAVTGAPVAYTNIGIEGTYYGTASDADGLFELKMPEEFAEKYIFFSAVGYINKKLKVGDLIKNTLNTIKLQPQNYSIGDVDVVAQNKVLIKILSLAAENIPQNMATGPISFNAIYTVEQTINDTINISQNAKVLFFDKTGYASPSVSNGYKNINYSILSSSEEGSYRFSEGATLLDDLLSFDWARIGASVLNPKLLPGFSLRPGGETVVNGKNCKVITFSQDQPTLSGSGDYYADGFKGKITIQDDNYQIVTIEGEITAPRNNRQGRSLAITTFNTMNPEHVKYQFKTDYNNQMVSAITLNRQYVLNKNRIIEKCRLDITGVETSNFTPIGSRQYFTGK